MKFKNPLSKKSDKKSDGGAEPSSNPYASAPDAGAPYTSGNSFSNSNSNPPPYQSVTQDQYRREKSPAVTGPGGGYGNSYGGSTGGYGRNQPYGAPQSNSSATGVRRAGGYGGFESDDPTGEADRHALMGNAAQRNGKTSQNGAAPQRYQSTPQTGVATTAYGRRDADPETNALFGNAPQRHQQKQQTEPYSQDYPSANGAGYGSSGYGAYGGTPKTAEEEEEDSIHATKQEMKFTRKQDIDTLGNALRMVDESMANAQQTLGNLVSQNERLNHTERVMDASSAQNKIAAQNTSTLRKVNATMFYRGNAKKQDERDLQNLRDHQTDREEKDRLVREAHLGKLRGQEAQQQLDRRLNGTGYEKPTLAEKAKYQFENDSEDERDEDEIDDRLGRMHRGVSGLKFMATAIGTEVDNSNSQLDRLGRKTDKVDDQITANRAQLNRIH